VEETVLVEDTDAVVEEDGTMTIASVLTDVTVTIVALEDDDAAAEAAVEDELKAWEEHRADKQRTRSTDIIAILSGLPRKRYQKSQRKLFWSAERAGGFSRNLDVQDGNTASIPGHGTALPSEWDVQSASSETSRPRDLGLRTLAVSLDFLTPRNGPDWLALISQPYRFLRLTPEEVVQSGW
jgi:hypothetical protein